MTQVIRLGLNFLFLVTLAQACPLHLFAACTQEATSPQTAEEGSDVDKTRPSTKELRSIGDMRKDMRAFVKHTKSPDPFVRQVAMLDLCVLHWEAATDPRYQGSQQLKSIRVSAKNRLQQFVNESRKQTKAKKKTSESSSSEQTIPIEQRIDAMNSSSAELMSALEGGPAYASDYLGTNFAPQFDHSEELIALIESTISPDVWRNNGTGEAAIHYYQPSLALVVSAPQEVQDRILILLHKLR